MDRWAAWAALLDSKLGSEYAPGTGYSPNNEYGAHPQGMTWHGQRYLQTPPPSCGMGLVG